MIENVLKMMNEPTSSAMTPKTSRNVLKKPSASLTSFWLSVVICVAGEHLDVLLARRASVLMLRTTCSCDTPGVGLHQDLVDLARLPEHAARGRRGEEHRGRAEQAVGVAELRDADELVVRRGRPS